VGGDGFRPVCFCSVFDSAPFGSSSMMVWYGAIGALLALARPSVSNGVLGGV